MGILSVARMRGVYGMAIILTASLALAGCLPGQNGVGTTTAAIGSPGRGVASTKSPEVISISPSTRANNNSPKVIGAATSGSTIEIYTNATCTGTPTATDTADVFSTTGITVAVLDNTTTTFYAKVGGNATSTCSNGKTYIEDSTAPAAPGTFTLSAPGNGSTSNNASPTISGTGAESGAQIVLYSNLTCTTQIGSTTVTTGGTFSFPAMSLVGDGARVFYYKISDSSGNSSACTNTGFGYTLDTTAPALPTMITMNSPNSATNSSDNTPNIFGNAAENTAVVSIYKTNTCTTVLSTGTVAAGAFTIAPFTVVGDGVVNFWYKITDTTGNSSACTATGLGYTLDTISPTGTALTINSAAVYTNSILVTLNITPGDANPSTVQIYKDGTCTMVDGAPIAYAANPAYTLQATSNTGQTVNVSIKVTDIVGQVGPCAATSIIYEPFTVLPRYSVAPNWNDYVRTANTAVACDGTELGQRACINGGTQKVVTTNETSCAGLVFSDVLGLWDWTCSIVATKATFYGTLKRTKSLADVVNAAAWKFNFVSLTGGSTAPCNAVVCSTYSRAWWTNPVQAAPSSAVAVQSLSTASTIYTISGTQNTYGYNINADKVALVGLTGSKLAWSNTSSTPNVNQGSGKVGTDMKAVIATGGQKFLWIEGTIYAYDSANAQTAHYGLYAMSMKHSVLRKLYIANAYYQGIMLTTSNSNLARDVILANNGISMQTPALDLYGSSYNAFTESRIFNNHHSGVHLDQYSGQNVFSQMFISNNGMIGSTRSDGIFVESSSKNIFTSISSLNNSGLGAYVGYTTAGYSSQYNIFHNMVTAGNYWATSTHQFPALDSDYGTFSNIVATNGGGGYGLSIYFATTAGTTGSDYNKVTGALILEAAANGSCYTNGIYGTYLWASFNNNCAAYGESNHSVVAQATGVQSSFVENPSANDVANPTDVMGVAAYALTTAFDWFSFDYTARSWGKLEMTGSFPIAGTTEGACTAGNCQIWDWTIKNTDTVIYKRTGDGSTAATAFTAGMACPTYTNFNYYLDSEKFTQDGSWIYAANAVEVLGDGYGNDDGVCDTGEYCTQRYLRTGVEIIGDDIGDDDGLCESGESCLYAPNFGGYLGHGVSTGTCTWTGGGASTDLKNIKMYGYSVNGI